MDINEFKDRIFEGMVFQKVEGSSYIKSIYNDGFTYAIGENGNTKKVTYDEIADAIEKINVQGFIDRRWHKTSFPKIAASRPCNFTSIGGVLQALEVVKYSGNGRYDDNKWNSIDTK